MASSTISRVLISNRVVDEEDYWGKLRPSFHSNRTSVYKICQNYKIKSRESCSRFVAYFDDMNA